MGRTKKGRKLSGWLIVDKPAGIGSTDVVNKVKWLLKAQKQGMPARWIRQRLGFLRWPLARRPRPWPS